MAESTCAHGFRASFSSIMNERHPDARDAIEAQLAHVVRGVRSAYLRAPFLERRREFLAEGRICCLMAPQTPRPSRSGHAVSRSPVSQRASSI